MGKHSPSPASGPGRRTAGWAVKILRGHISDPTPEERLWLAVIEQAVREAYAGAPADPDRREDARRWLESEDFDEVAGLLGLHPRWARETIRKLEGIGEASAAPEAVPLRAA